MSDEIFVDSNILVYAFDESEKQKRNIAKKIIREVTIGNKKGVISNQVLGEFFVVITKKIDNPVEKEKAQIIINGFIDSVHWKKIDYTTRTISRSIEAVIKEKIPFWDSLIVETMLENKVYTILTENTKHFKSKHILVKNPF